MREEQDKTMNPTGKKIEKPHRRDLLEKYVKALWEAGFDVNTTIKLSWKPTDGFGGTPKNAIPPTTLKVSTDFGKIVEVCKSKVVR